MPGLKLGKSLRPYQTYCPASPHCFHHGAVSLFNCGRLAAPAFCSSLLVFWVNVAFEADKTVYSLSPGVKMRSVQLLKTEPLCAMAAVFYLSV